MPQIQDPDLTARLRRKFAIVGNESIDTLAPELVGVVLVESLIPERQDFDASIHAQVTGDTGDIPEIGLRNLSAEKLLKITQIHVSLSGIAVVSLRLGIVGGTVIPGGNTFHTDFRNPLGAAAVGENASNLNSAGGSGAGIMRSRLLGNTPLIWYPRNLVLRFAGTTIGGTFFDRIHVDAALAATTLNVGYVFHFIDPELTGRAP